MAACEARAAGRACAALRRPRLPLLAAAALVLIAPVAAGAREGRVPAPFEPVRVESGDAAVELRVWGRHYRFEAGPLPGTVTSQGRELFAAPARILIDGEPITWSRPVVAEARPDGVRLTSHATRSSLRIEAETLVEYDGMIRVDLAIAGPGRPSSLRYELRLVPERAALFNHHLPYDYGLLNIDKIGSVSAAGTTSPGRRRFAFTPSFWLGDRDVGIEWWSETNAHWEGPGAREPFAVERSDAAVVLAVEPLSAPLALAEGERWRDRFALFPMPMRPPPAGWRSIRFVSQGTSAPRFAPGGGAKLAWVSFGFHPRWHGLPAAIPDEFQRDLRRRLDAREILYIPYGKLTVAPSLHPRTMERFEDWSATGGWFKAAPSSEAKIFQLNGLPYVRGQPFTYAVCMGRRDYLDWILEENLNAFSAEELDGLYFDHGAITRMCSRSPVLRGHPGREVWEYFEVRDFYKRLYTEMKARKPGALLVIHTVGQPRALSAFVDYHWIGEHLNAVFSGGRSGAAAAASPPSYRADYLGLPEGYLDALTRPHVGGAWVILPQIKQAEPHRVRAYHRALQAWALLHDVPLVIGNTDMKEAEAIARTLDTFGSLAEAELYPWWSAGDRLRADEPLRATLYRVGQRGLLVVANLGDRSASGTVKLDRARLGLPEAARWSDLERPARKGALRDGAFPIEVPARDFRVLAIE